MLLIRLVYNRLNYIIMIDIEQKLNFMIEKYRSLYEAFLDFFDPIISPRT